MMNMNLFWQVFHSSDIIFRIWYIGLHFHDSMWNILKLYSHDLKTDASYYSIDFIVVHAEIKWFYSACVLRNQDVNQLSYFST